MSSQGFTRKRGKTWTWYLETTDPATGACRQLSKGGYRTKGEALDGLEGARSTHRRHGYVEPARMTVEQYLTEHWLPTVNKRPTTMLSYRGLLELYVIPRIGGLALVALTPAHVRDMVAGLDDSHTCVGKPLSARTVNYTLTVLRMALSAAVRSGLLARNPSEGVSGPHRQQREVEAWTAAEAGQFLRSVSDDRLYALWLLMLTRGPWRGEVCGLRWSDVDLNAGRLSIVRTVVLVNNTPADSTPKTAAGRRTVPLDADLGAALRANCTRQTEERLLAGPAWQDTGLVFTREDGSALHPQYLSTAFGARVK